jgi:tRNA threonylcarbamoyl adenosine modification protein YeaZ
MGRTSVALADGSPPKALLVKRLEGKTQAEGLIPLIAALMSGSATDFSALDRVAVCTGPGGFSSIRTGVAAARGIGLAAELPVVGATSFAIMAAAFRKARGDFSQAVGLVAPAGINMFFCRIARPETESEIHLFTADEALEFFSGEAAVLSGPAAPALAASGLAEIPVVMPELAPDASTLAEIAHLLDPDHDRPIPYYARPADARPQAGYAVERRAD